MICLNRSASFPDRPEVLRKKGRTPTQKLSVKMCPHDLNGRTSLWIRRTGLDDPSNVRRAFCVLDRDGDGRIAFCDLQEFFNSFPVGKNVGKEDIELMISVADADRNGSVDLEEFHRLIAVFLEEEKWVNGSDGNSSGGADNLAEETWVFKELFSMMDKDGDGVVSLEDLKRFMDDCIGPQNPLPEDDLVAMIEAAGGSAKSGVCYPDLVALMTFIMNGS